MGLSQLKLEATSQLWEGLGPDVDSPETQVHTHTSAGGRHTYALPLTHSSITDEWPLSSASNLRS
jgi:hypothetical protein